MDLCRPHPESADAGKKVDKVQKRAARQESNKLLKRLGKECERQHKSLATAGAGQLEALLTCLRADPSSARVAAHCINRTLHPVPRKSKKKQSAVESRDKDKNDKNSRPQSTRLQPTRHHAER